MYQLKHDYSIPVTKVIRSLILHLGRIDRKTNCTMAKTISQMIGIPESDGPGALYSAWKSSQKFKNTRFAKMYNLSKIEAVINIQHEDYEEAIDSEDKHCKKLMSQRIDRFSKDKTELYLTINRNDIRQVDQAINKLLTLRQLLTED